MFGNACLGTLDAVCACKCRCANAKPLVYRRVSVPHFTEEVGNRFEPQEQGEPNTKLFFHKIWEIFEKIPTKNHWHWDYFLRLGAFGWSLLWLRLLPSLGFFLHGSSCQSGREGSTRDWVSTCLKILHNKKCKVKNEIRWNKSIKLWLKR